METKMKKLFLTLIMMISAISFSYAQFDFGFGSDISILKVDESGVENFTGQTLATANLGGYIFINDSWYGIYRPLTFSFGMSGQDKIYSITFGLGFGAKWQIDEENSIIAGLAPVFTYYDISSESISGGSPSAFLIGGGLDVHYRYEPFSDENISLSFIVGARSQWSPIAFLNSNPSYSINQLIAIRPYAGLSVKFDTSRNNYVMSGPGF